MAQHPGTMTEQRDMGFWCRIGLTAIVVTFPWAYALVMFGMSLIVVMIGVVLSGVATLIIWDSRRISETVVGWLKGEPLRDRSSGLYNPQAWADLLLAEEDRCKRYELPASVVVVKVSSESGSVDDLARRAGLAIRKVSRAHDVVACLAQDTYAVLAINSKEPNADAMVGRLRNALTGQNFTAEFSVASRQSSRTLEGAFADAQRDLIRSA